MTSWLKRWRERWGEVPRTGAQVIETTGLPDGVVPPSASLTLPRHAVDLFDVEPAEPSTGPIQSLMSPYEPAAEVWTDVPDDAPPIERHDEVLEMRPTGRCSCGRPYGHDQGGKA